MIGRAHIRHRLTRALAVGVVTGILCIGAGPATALTPPVVRSGDAPSGPVAPTDKTKQSQQCARPVLAPGTDLEQVDPTGMAIDYRSAWTYSTGKRQTVAVIDTGVRPGPRLRRVIDGGDYVSNGNGLTDCDAHGTLVAGLIAARPAPGDTFSGLAPDATILSIRQNSDSYGIDGRGGNDYDPNDVSAGYGNTTTLAYAITRAVTMGATVINISAAACGASGSGLDDAAVGRAVRSAFRRNVVVVAAAGNTDDDTCPQNRAVDPNLPREETWPKMTTYASPAWFADYVLSVGSLNANTEPSSFSLLGPWVSVAAPGENVVSLSNTGNGLVNRQVVKDGQTPFNGTSFAAAVVSGTVALVRERFPQLTAGQVIDLIKRTSHTAGHGPDLASGYGIVDPIAALTADPTETTVSAAVPTKAVAGPETGVEGHRARNIALLAAGLSAFFIAAAWALFTPIRRNRDRATAYQDVGTRPE